MTKVKPMTETQAGPNDVSKETVVELDNNALHIRNDGTYGHWEIYYEKGLTPENLRGKWTSRKHAEDAVAEYLKKKNITPKE